MRTSVRVSVGFAALALTGAAISVPTPSGAATARVLRVGVWHGVKGTYPTIQAAVDAAHAGDWVLVGPGDWKERGDFTTHKPASGEPGWGVSITTPGLHLRGMNRNTVVVDGTKPGTAKCSNKRADQTFGPNSSGRSGIVASKVDGVWIENLTVCNFLGEGNQIWWNGGDGSGKVGMGAYYGSYLTATTTYWSAADPAGTYGIFVSNAKGPGTITKTYASNMNDSSYYIGACPDCNAVLDHPWAEHSALGYSGTNSGGHLIIQYGTWDDNQSGIVSNSQNNDDAPSPQDGACPSGGGSCEIWRYNNVFNNNDPNVPQDTGAASAGPVGTGMVMAGSRNVTVLNNNVHDNNAWGILTTPYPDTEVPPSGIGQDCNGGFTGSPATPLVGTTGNVPCYFSDWGNEVAHNTFAHNGSYGNATNGDIGDISQVPPENPTANGNCWHDNTDTSGTLSEWPQTLSTTNGSCPASSFPDPVEVGVLTVQVACDSGLLFKCPATAVANYPATTKVTVKPLPSNLAPMPNPCAGVPVNPWCPASTSVKASSGGRSTGRSLAATGLDVAIPTAAVVLIGLGLAARRRRRV
jgi:hypothetical protein